MEISFLGSGTGIPSLEKSAPGILIKIGTEPLLFDCGSGTLTRLLLAGVVYTDLNHVFFTHTHSDHTADLIPLIQALRTTPHYQRTSELHLYGPSSFTMFMEILSQAYGQWVMTPEFPLTIHEFLSDQFTTTLFQIQTAPMRHSRAAIGYRIEDGHGATIVYSGDTEICQEIVDLAHHADILILECSFTDDHPVPGHLTPTAAATIAARAGCRHLVLTHLYPPFDKIEAEILTRCKTHFHGEISIARDFLRITL